MLFGDPNDVVLPLFRNKYTTYLQWRQQQDNYSSTSSGDSDDADDNTPRDVEKRIRLPNLKYGYRTVPLEWEEIVYAVQHDIALLSRSVTQQQDYEIYKRDLVMGRDNQWQSVLDHVLCTKFPHIFQPILVLATASDAAAASEEEPQQPEEICDDRQNGRRQRRALRQRHISGWLGALVTMPVYWFMMSAAAWYALWQFMAAPFHWNKTEHGLSALQKRQRSRTQGGPSA